MHQRTSKNRKLRSSLLQRRGEGHMLVEPSKSWRKGFLTEATVAGDQPRSELQSLSRKGREEEMHWTLLPLPSDLLPRPPFGQSQRAREPALCSPGVSLPGHREWQTMDLGERNKQHNDHFIWTPPSPREASLSLRSFPVSSFSQILPIQLHFPKLSTLPYMPHPPLPCPTFTRGGGECRIAKNSFHCHWFFSNMTCRTRYTVHSTFLFLSVSLELSLRGEERIRAEKNPCSEKSWRSRPWMPQPLIPPAPLPNLLYLLWDLRQTWLCVDWDEPCR